MVNEAPAAPATPSAAPSAPVAPPETPTPETPAATPPATPLAPKPGSPVPPAVPAKETPKPLETPEPKPGEEIKPPEAYDLKIPEGSPLTKDDITRVSKIAKENGFSNEDAQGLLEYENEAVKAFVTKQQATLAEAKTTWLNESKADKEIGGEKFPENVELAKRVVQRFGSDAFKKELDQTGLGNHPELIRFVMRIGRAMSDDVLIAGSPAGPTKKDNAADKLYPTTAAKA